MKRSGPFILLLIVLAAITGWLLSHISLLGRVGINLAYKEYKFLKVWWQAGGLVLFIWLIFFSLHLQASKSKPSNALSYQILAIVAAIVGIYLTYYNFRTDLSHRWLGERFHLGAYMFWIGWILISLFFMFRKTNPTASDSQMEVERPQ